MKKIWLLSKIIKEHIIDAPLAHLGHSGDYSWTILDASPSSLCLLLHFNYNIMGLVPLIFFSLAFMHFSFIIKKRGKYIGPIRFQYRMKYMVKMVSM
jgi:hypothetical protein